jgi:hypothetical protein
MFFRRAPGYRNLVGQQASILRCEQCGAETDELATGWRAHLAADYRGEDVAVLLFCRDCVNGESEAVDPDYSR